MFAAITAALGFVFRWLLGAGTIKWAFLAVVGFGFASLLDLLLDLLPSWFGTEGLTTAAAVFPPSVWYFMDYFNVQAGLSMMFGAYVVHFLIRRLPVIG